MTGASVTFRSQFVDLVASTVDSITDKWLHSNTFHHRTLISISSCLQIITVNSEQCTLYKTNNIAITIKYSAIDITKSTIILQPLLACFTSTTSLCIDQWSQGKILQKWLNRLRCRLGDRLVRALRNILDQVPWSGEYDWMICVLQQRGPMPLIP